MSSFKKRQDDRGRTCQTSSNTLWTPDKGIVFATTQPTRKHHTHIPLLATKRHDDRSGAISQLESQLERLKLGIVQPAQLSDTQQRQSLHTSANLLQYNNDRLPLEFANDTTEGLESVACDIAWPDYENDTYPVVQTQSSLALHSEAFAAWANTEECRSTYFIRDGARQTVLRRSPVLAIEEEVKPYWTWRMYHGPQKRPPLKHYCTTWAQIEEYAKLFLNEKVLGLDLEWKSSNGPPCMKQSTKIKDSVSLIQLASESHIGLFHIAVMQGETAEELMPPNLKKIIESPEITKVGVAIASDCTRLRKHLGIDPQAYLELSHIHNLLQACQSGIPWTKRAVVGLKDLTEEYLGFPLAKGEVRTSNWAISLNMDQTDYAADDVYASLHVFYALNERRLALDPRPPLPPHFLVSAVTPKKPAASSRKDSSCKK